MTVITVADISKKFPVKRGAPQVLYLLQQHGPLTIWQLVDRLEGKHGIHVPYVTVKRTLHRLREKGHVGVVNWTEEMARIKTTPKYRWSARYGDKKGGIESAEVWGLVKIDG